MSASGGPLRPVYILLDNSGSTVRGGFAAGLSQAMPVLIDAAARQGGLLLAILGYGTRADTLVWLSDPADIKLIPEVRPAGLSSMAAGLRLLADSVRADTARLAGDGIACLLPATLIVADGLPTDPAPVLLEARSALGDALADAAATRHPAAPAGSLLPVFAAPPETDRLAIAGLGLDFHPLATQTPDALAGSIAAAFRGLITRLPGQREDDLLAVVVEADDLGLDRLAGRDHVGRLADPVRSEPADVDDALDSVPEIDVGERLVRVADDTRDHLPDPVRRLVPGVGVRHQPLPRKFDLFALVLEPDDLYLAPLSHRGVGRHIGCLPVRPLADVDHTRYRIARLSQIQVHMR
jgi:hypothetical protein